MNFEKLIELEQYIKKKSSSQIEEIYCQHNELNVVVLKENLLKFLFFLRDDPHCAFVGFIDISAADFPSRPERFEIAYHLLSPHHNLRIRIKTFTNEEDPLPSACVVYAGAEWYEREIYDFFGVLFTGHPDLRRILTDYGFIGHPLRKDFPTSGFVECRYDKEARRVVYEPVLLRQEMRNFDFLTPWEGDSHSEIEKKKLGNENE